MNAARSWALAQPAAKKEGGGATGCIGFCWGGSTSFAYAAAQKELKAAIVCYGTAPTEKEALARVTAPVLGLYGGDDARVTATVDDTTKVMKELGKSYRSEIFEGAGHGFMRQQTGRDGANLPERHRFRDVGGIVVVLIEDVGDVPTHAESRGVGGHQGFPFGDVETLPERADFVDAAGDDSPEGVKHQFGIGFLASGCIHLPEPGQSNQTATLPPVHS